MKQISELIEELQEYEDDDVFVDFDTDFDDTPGLNIMKKIGNNFLVIGNLYFKKEA